MKTTKKSGVRAAGKTATKAPARAAPRSRKPGAGNDPRQRDPHLEREKQRYENPLPSREYVLQTLREQGVPLGEVQLAKLVGVRPEEFDVFSRRLAAMERDGQILRNRRGAIGLLDKLDLVPGRVDGHPDGFGFCIPDDGSADIWLSPREMHQVLHGDRVVVRVKGRDNRGRPEGSIVEVLQRKNRTLVGRIYCENGVWFVAAENRRIAQDILIAPGQHAGAQPGQVVTVELLTQPSRAAEPTAKVVEVLGNYGDSGMEIEIALRKHDLPYEFPPEAAKQADRLPEGVQKSDLKGREDIRHLPLVTIDGEDARDFDDAVYCERTPKGWKLYVAIADVSSYVRMDTALDDEAQKRGTSVYFPNRVIPMLPEVLSNGLCSLNPHTDRLCMVCELTITAEGALQKYRFFAGLMNSHARLTYTEVAAILAGDKAARRQHRELIPHLEELHSLYKAFRRAREDRAAIDFETQESRIIFGEGKKIDKIVPVVRNDAHKLIEECMLAANTAAALFLEKNKLPHLVRIHEGPGAEKLADLRTLLGRLGLSLGGGDQPEPKDYCRLIDEIAGRPDEHLIQTVLLRSMAQAVYSPEQKGHFGLALDMYTHFTSPIRRYPDLLVHRAIRHAIEGKKKATFRYGPSDMAQLGEHCSFTERRADEATRNVVAWLTCEYMQDKLGEEFSGAVSAVTAFGFFVGLKDIFIEGLVHVSSLDKDYFHYDPAGLCLKGERTGLTYRLGDVVRVIVARVNLDDRKIDLDLVKPPEPAPTEAAARKKRRRRKS